MIMVVFGASGITRGVGGMGVAEHDVVNFCVCQIYICIYIYIYIYIYNSRTSLCNFYLIAV